MMNVTRSGFRRADAASARSAEAETRCCVPVDRRGQQRVELVTPTTEDPAHPLVERLSKGEGLFRLVLHVPDLAACELSLVPQRPSASTISATAASLKWARRAPTASVMCCPRTDLPLGG